MLKGFQPSRLCTLLHVGFALPFNELVVDEVRVYVHDDGISVFPLAYLALPPPLCLVRSRLSQKCSSDVQLGGGPRLTGIGLQYDPRQVRLLNFEFPLGCLKSTYPHFAKAKYQAIPCTRKEGTGTIATRDFFVMQSRASSLDIALHDELDVVRSANKRICRPRCRGTHPRPFVGVSESQFFRDLVNFWR